MDKQPNTKKLEQLIKALDSFGAVSKEEQISFMQDVVNVLSQFKSATGEINKNTTALNQNTTETLNSVLKNLQEEFDSIRQEVKKETRTKIAISDEIQEEIDNKTEEKKKRLLGELLSLFNQFKDEVRGMKPRDGRDGKDANEDIVTLKVLSKLPKPKVVLYPEELRNKLEELEGGERLDAKAIKNLPEATKTVIERMGGGTSQRVVAGTGVTISLDGNGSQVINASGGSGTVASVAALTLGTTGTDLSSTVANGTTTPVITLQVPTASASNRGALSSTDWSTFNSKAPALGADDNYVTDAEKIVIGNTSGTNTGDASGHTALAPKDSPVFTTAVTLPVALTGVIRADSGVVSVDTDVTDIVAAGTSTAQGKLELAIDSEAVTGTDTARAVTSANLVAKMSAPGAIGNTTASTGKFTTVETTGGIELGAATDTTITRVSAGVIAVESVTVPTISSTNTLTNKAITKRTVTTTDDATAVIDVTITDIYELTAIANNTTFSTTGTPVDGQGIVIRWKDAGVSKTITWDAIFVAIGVTLPVATTAGKWQYVGCQYNSDAAKFHAIAVVTQA